MSFDQPIISNFDERKPYIFISYAHVDSKRVYPIINKLQQDGFRIWYDDGIGPGSEWPNTIAAYLKKSTFFLAFLSKAYFKSSNCLDELNQARDLKDTTKCLLIYIEQAEMDDGMRLRYSRVQAIEWYRFDADRCYNKLYSTRDFAKCNVSGSVPQIAVVPAGGMNNGFNQSNSSNQQPPQWPTGGRIGRNSSKGGQSRDGRKNKLIIIAVAAIGVLVLGTAVYWLAVVPAVQKIVAANASDEAGNMNDSYNEDDFNMDADDVTDSGDDYNEESGGNESSIGDTASSEDRVKLTSIESPVEYGGNFFIKKDAVNTMGTTYKEAVSISDANEVYIRYNVGDFNRFIVTYSMDNEGNPSEGDSSLLVYLDENEEEPLIDTKVSRSTVETPLDIDVSSAQFITFAMKRSNDDYSGCALLLTDGYLSNETALSNAKAAGKGTGVPQSEEQDTLKLTSIESPVEYGGNFYIKEEAVNTMGTTYKEAVSISDANSAYVRYNVGDFSRFIGTLSMDSEINSAVGDSSLVVYLDENEEEPLIDIKATRSTVETPLDIDVSSAQFITFAMKRSNDDYNGCALLLTDCYLSNDSSLSAAETTKKGTGIPMSAEKDTIKLTAIELPVEYGGNFYIKEDAVNTMGTTYEKAVSVSDANFAYVRYNVGDFSRFTGTLSMDSEINPSEGDSSLLIYLDENEDTALIDTKVTRSTVETPLDIDVSSAQFITFAIRRSGDDYNGCALLLTDCVLSK